jgi:arylamine N-acetyltransferase
MICVIGSRRTDRETATLDARQRARYLDLLGLQARPPSAEALAELVAAHLARVPFENVSKLLRWRRGGPAVLPTFDEFLDGAERDRLGGTCYANNIHVWSLLRSLGYNARLCGADMRRPDVHAVVLAAVDGREWLVDAGYGAPFLRPFPRDASEPVAVERGRDRWVLEPMAADGSSRLTQLRDGAKRHGYVVRPTARAPEHFAGAIADSFRPDATFLNALVVARFEAERSIVLHNDRLVIVAAGRETVTELAGRDAISRAAEEHHGIPAALVLEAVAGVARFENVWG